MIRGVVDGGEDLEFRRRQTVELLLVWWRSLGGRVWPSEELVVVVIHIIKYNGRRPIASIVIARYRVLVERVTHRIPVPPG